MDYISSDTNVWIDYTVINKQDLPFRLSITYLMSIDALNDELLSPSGIKEKLLSLGLQPTELTESEFYYAINMAKLNPRLSKYDCSALSIAKHRGLVLLTGDGRLRKTAMNEGIPVMGTIGLLDKLYDENKISSKEYVECLYLLKKANGMEVRLPMDELDKRLNMFDL